MDNSFSAWFIILLGIAAANLPFLSERLFLVLPTGRAVKPLWMRLIELVVLYGAVIGIGRLLESRAGNAFSQGWEFYAITACLFIVLAYPGFVLRYLRRRHG